MYCFYPATIFHTDLIQCKYLVITLEFIICAAVLEKSSLVVVDRGGCDIV